MKPIGDLFNIPVETDVALNIEKLSFMNTS